MNINPSSYKWLIPMYDPIQLDQLANSSIFPSVAGIFPALYYAVLFGVIRITLSYFILKPLALSGMNLKLTSFNSLQDIETLINFKNVKKINENDILSIAKKTSKSVKEITGYLWMRRRYYATELKIKKFIEALWRFLFYSFFCFLGIRVLFVPNTASWVLDTREHWISWPIQELHPLIYFYYQIELGAYIHQLMWTEIQRSDAVEMLIHHLVTIFLISLSFLTGFTRIGSSIMLVHDLADIFLESGKCLNYIANVKGNGWLSPICDTFFGLFTITFFISRLIIFPKYLLYSLLYEAPAILGPWPGYYVFASLLIILQILHIFWFYLILKTIYKLFLSGNLVDVRSDDEEDNEKKKT